MVGMGEPPILLASTLTSLQPRMGIKDLGLFVYPLGLCMILSLFVVAERTFSLRKGSHFPTKSRESSSNRRISQQEMEKRLFGGKNCLGGDP